MKKLRHHLLLPTLIAAGSFLCLGILTLFTNPIEDVRYVAFFFVFFLIFLLSIGHLIIYLQVGQLRSIHRYRIFIASLFLLTLLMFGSAQSLSWVDALVLLLITVGLLFYSGRRAA